MHQQFEPKPYLRISEPRQIKAFSDPLRVRILRILGPQAATNQQLAQMVDVPPAKLLHHLRFLVDADLVHLVDERIKGGNVEKYYRASARIYGLDPDPESKRPVTESIPISAVNEAVASAALWPDTVPEYEGRRARISPHRLGEFQQELNALIDEYWGGPDGASEEDADAEMYAFMSMIYRFPGNQV